MYRSRAWVEVHLDRLRDNAREVQNSVGRASGILPMVKANAYGLGLEVVTRALLPVDPWGFGVATVSEAVALRNGGWTGPALVFSPVTPDDLARAAAADLTLCLSSVDMVERWAAMAASTGQKLRFHIEIDTGMGRAGLPAEEAGEWGAAVQHAAAGKLVWEGCFTHFHSADEPDPAPTDLQWSRFNDALAALPAVAPGEPERLIHVANSAACMRRGGFHCDLVRPGIFLYGGYVGGAVEPFPVAEVHARLVHVREVQAGATAGYGATYTAQNGQRWGTLAIGYGDGLPRALGAAGGAALVRGHVAPIIGRISMDMTTIDLTDVPNANVGDIATLIGRDGDAEILLDEVARQAGTISYEILTGLSPRLPRIYRDD